MMSKIKMGMIGGDLKSFIGPIHRIAASINGNIELVCGAFSSNYSQSKNTGKALGLDEKRVYKNYKQMIELEKELPVEERMNFVVVVTPNHLHFKPCKMALENGFHVLVEKPVTFSLKEAEILKEIIDKSNLFLGITYTYTGYPLVKEAKHIVKKGKIGFVRKIYVNYKQGWLSSSLEKEGNPQAIWRTNPKKAGIGGAVVDIGTHAANLAEYITDSKITELSAMLNKVVDGRVLDDDAAALIRFSNGATGVLIASQVAFGEENNLNIEVYGDHGSLKWYQEQPNSLYVKIGDEPIQTIRAAQSYLHQHTSSFFRTPSGHPEGYLEAFANIYKVFVEALKHQNNELDNTKLDFPNIDDGIRSMKFINAAVTSSNKKGKWINI